MTPKASQPNRTGATVFDTPLGEALVAWTERGILELRLPDPADELRSGEPLGSWMRRARGHCGSAIQANDITDEDFPIIPYPRAPSWVQSVTRRVSGHLGGRLDDLLDVPLDLPRTASSFDLDVWSATREVPPGVTITYGELAEEAGHPGAARGAGGSLRRCPIELLIPAHRVIAAGRRPGGWTGKSGVQTKLCLLAIEGVVLD